MLHRHRQNIASNWKWTCHCHGLIHRNSLYRWEYCSSYWILAESPSTPSYVPTNWIWTSHFDISFCVFLIRAETFWTASLAIFFSIPVAIIWPSDVDWVGVTSAIMGRTIPDPHPWQQDHSLFQPVRLPLYRAYNPSCAQDIGEQAVVQRNGLCSLLSDMCGGCERCIFPMCDIPGDTDKTSKIPEFEGKMTFSSGTTACFADNSSTALLSKCGIFPSLTTSGQRTWQAFACFGCVLYGIAHIYLISITLDTGAKRWVHTLIASRFPAATIMKSHGTGSVLTMAPLNVRIVL